MRKILMVTACVLTMVAHAWGATYYVSPSGSNTSPYDTWAKAANLPETAVTAGKTDVGGDGPHIVYIAPGTYDSQIYPGGDADWAGGKFIGVASIGTTDPAAKGQVVIASSSTYTVRMNVDSVTFENLSLSQTGSNIALYFTTGGNNFVGDNLYIFNPGTNAINMASGITGASFKNCLITGAGSTVAVDIQGTATFTFTIFMNSDTMALGTQEAVRNSGAGTLTLNNCIIGGSFAGRGVLSTSTGITNINSSIVFPCIDITDSPPVYATSGTINVNNSQIIKNHQYNHYTTGATGGTINTSNLVSDQQTKITSHARHGYIIPAIDDLYAAGRIDYVESIEAVLSSRGLKGTWYVDAKSVAANLSDLQAIAARGTIEIGSHSFSHSTLSLTGNTFSITSPSGQTIDIDRDTDTITITGVGTVTGFKAKNLTDIKSELTALGCAIGSNQSGIEDETLGEIFTDSSGAQASPYTPQILIDETAQTGFFWVEMVHSKEILEAAIQPVLPSYICRSFATPGGESSASVIAALPNAGYEGARHTYSGSSYLLSSINAFNRGYLSWTTFLGDTEEDMVSNIKAMCESYAQFGFVYDLLAHDTDEATAEEWAAVLDAIMQYNDISVVSHAEFLDTIEASPWSTADNITYTRTWSDQSDYHLASGSPAFNAGTEAAASGLSGAQEDYYGESYTFPGMYNLNIGIDQNQLHVPKILGGTITGGTFVSP